MNTDDKRHVLPLIANDATVKGSGVFKSVIGQDEARKKLVFFVDSHSTITPFPTLLKTGSQGLGKSFMAEKVAEALGRRFVDINCGTIETAKDFIEGVLIGKVFGDTPTTILMDEAHKLSTEVTTTLLTLLNPTNTNKNYLSYKNWNIEYNFARINMIFATTDAHRIFKPLVNRCEEIYFHIYSNKELFAILGHYLPNIKVVCNKDDIAYACRGRARDAFLLAQKIQRYCNKEGITVFKDSDWNNIKDIFSIHSYGLKTEEVQLLKIIGDSEPISSANLAVRMGVNVQNIESELETRARELGFIESGTRGRCLTDKGREYLEV